MIETALPHRKLPVWAVVKRSYGYVWERRTNFAVPMLIVFALFLAAGYFFRARSGASLEDGSADVPGPLFLYDFIVAVFSMSFIVGVHQTVLLNELRPGIAFLRWDLNLLRYIGTWLLLILFGVLIFGIVIGVATVMVAATTSMLKSGGTPNQRLAALLAIYAIIIIGYLIFLRFALALPAAAIAARKRFAMSWRATRGNWLRLVAVSILTILPFFIVNLAMELPQLIDLISGVQTGVLPPIPTPGIAAQIIAAAVRAIDIAVLTVMLSLSYDILVRGGGPSAEGQTIH